MPFLTRADKERRVIELLEQGKSTREIAEEVRISFGDIGSIRSRHFGEAEPQTKKEQGAEIILSKDTKVLKLFEAGRTPVQVAIELDLKPDEVSRLYKAWQQLKGLHDLNQLYEERKNDLVEFHAAYKIMKDGGVSPIQLVDAAKCLKQLSLLEPRRNKINNEIQNNESHKQGQMNELSILRNHITLARQEVDSYASIINSNKEEIARLSHHLRELESIIARLKNTGEYRRVDRAAEVAARKILADNKMILEIALSAVIQALKDDPDLQLVIFGSPKYPTYDAMTDSSIRNYLILYNTKILKMTGQIFDNILGRCVSNTMSSALSMT